MPVFLFLLLLMPLVYASEAFYNKQWCLKNGGIVEYYIAGKRVDCLLDDFAVETDWATYKTYESVLQSLNYARLTGRNAGILLLIKDDKGYDWLYMLYDNILYYNLPIRVWQYDIRGQP